MYGAMCSSSSRYSNRKLETNYRRVCTVKIKVTHHHQDLALPLIEC